MALNKGSKIAKEDGSTFDRGQSWPSIAALTLMMSASAILFNNCSNEFSLKEGPSELMSFEGMTVCEAEQAKAFSGTIYPFTTSRCVSCHNVNGQSGTAFASNNINGAWKAFQYPGFEKFKSYALNPGHVNGITGPENAPTVGAAEAAWLAAENSPQCKDADNGGGIPAMTIAKPISATATNRVISWNLGTETEAPTDYGGATFEITIRQATPTGGNPTYYIANPIVKTAATAMEARSLSVFINGEKYIEGTTFLGIDRYIPAANTTTPLVTATMLKQMPNGIQATDTIAISFAHLSRSTGPAPTPTPTPGATPAPINGQQLFAQVCMGCHTPAARAGRTAAQINAARMNVGAMINNAAVQALSQAEVEAIAAYLGTL